MIYLVTLGWYYWWWDHFQCTDHWRTAETSRSICLWGNDFLTCIDILTCIEGASVCKSHVVHCFLTQGLHPRIVTEGFDRAKEKSLKVQIVCNWITKPLHAHDFTLRRELSWYFDTSVCLTVISHCCLATNTDDLSWTICFFLFKFNCLFAIYDLEL